MKCNALHPIWSRTSLHLISWWYLFLFPDIIIHGKTLTLQWMILCRLGRPWWICLSEGLCGVFLLSWETECCCWEVSIKFIFDLHCCELQGRNSVQCWTLECECCDMGCVPRKGGDPAHSRRPSELHGVEGWGFPDLGRGLGLSVSWRRSLNKGSFRGKSCVFIPDKKLQLAFLLSTTVCLGLISPLSQFPRILLRGFN